MAEKNRLIRLSDSNSTYVCPVTKSDGVFMSDGNTTLETKMNEVTSQLEQNTNYLKVYSINAMFPPAPLKGVKGDGVTDDYLNFKAIFDYAISNKIKVFIPNPSVKYFCSQGFIFNETIDIEIEGGSKEQCLFYFGSSTSVGFWFKRGRLKFSHLNIKTEQSNEPYFKSLLLGDTNNINVNDSLHWSIISNIKISGTNQGIVIGNMYDSSFYDVEVLHLVGENASGVNFVGGTNVDANNLIFNRLHIEWAYTNGAKFLNFNAGSESKTANFVFNGCHFETHKLNSNVIVLKDVANVTFVSCHITHSSAEEETVINDKLQTFIFHNALAIKFIACGIGGSFVTTEPTSVDKPKLIKIGGNCNYISFDNCMISPTYQHSNFSNSSLFNIDNDFNGNYPTFVNSMISNKNYRIDPFMLEFSYMNRYNNKMYVGTGSDYGLHISPNKWDINSIPDNENNYVAFNSFTQTGFFRTSGLVGRHSGIIEPTTKKTIAFYTRTGVEQSGLYVINVQQANGNSYSALFDYNNFQQKVTLYNNGTIFTNTKDTTSKINLYHENEQLQMQNTTSENIKYSIVPFLLNK